MIMRRIFHLEWGDGGSFDRYMRRNVNFLNFSILVLHKAHNEGNLMTPGFWIILMVSIWGRSIDPMTFLAPMALIKSYRQIFLGITVFGVLIIMSVILDRMLDERRAIALEDDESITHTYDEVVFKVSNANKEPEFDRNPLGLLLLTNKKVAFATIMEEELAFIIPITKIIEVGNLYNVMAGSPRKTRNVRVTYFEDESVKNVTFQLKNEVKACEFVQDLRASVISHPSHPPERKKVAIHID